MNRKPYPNGEHDYDDEFWDDRDRRPLGIPESEWLKEYPDEITAIFTGKVVELKVELRTLKRELGQKLRIITETETDEFAGWFAKQWLKATDAAKIAELESRVAHFKRLLRLSSHGPSNWDGEVARAREMPIMEIASCDTHLRRSGKSHVGRCPFHEERTPSFHVYPSQNSFHCFGCAAHGDVITYTMMRNQLSFKEAVWLLSGGPNA
jgi:hypothetical protein